MTNTVRVLVIDDNRAIHEDFRKTISRVEDNSELDELESLLFEVEPSRRGPLDTYSIDSAYHGEEGAQMVQAACAAGQPYAIVLTDMRMPLGWDGVQTAEAILKTDAAVQVIICSAYCDHAWEDIRARFGAIDRLLFMKKPFDAPVVRQLFSSLAAKWRLGREATSRVAELAKSLAVAQAIQDTIEDGVLVIDGQRRVVSLSSRFARIWKIPPELVASGSDAELVGHVLDNVVDPEGFLHRIHYLYEHQDEASDDRVALKDGRVLRRWSGPLRGDDGTHYGRVWRFRELTQETR